MRAFAIALLALVACSPDNGMPNESVGAQEQALACGAPSGQCVHIIVGLEAAGEPKCSFYDSMVKDYWLEVIRIGTWTWRWNSDGAPSPKCAVNFTDGEQGDTFMRNSRTCNEYNAQGQPTGWYYDQSFVIAPLIGQAGDHGTMTITRRSVAAPSCTQHLKMWSQQ